MLELRSATVRYGSVAALRDLTLDVARGEVVAVMGRNGAGKSTLLATAVGLTQPDSGTVRVDGRDPVSLRGPELLRAVGLVPQQPTDLLVADSVAVECAGADRDAGATAGSTRALLERLSPGIPGDTHPRDLSEGQRLALALSVILVAAPPLLLLDEPTRGLDYAAKARLAVIVRRLRDDGHAIVLVTHDVELAADVASRVVVLADGEVVTDGAAREIVVGSPMFAPQVAKVLAPLPILTVPEVADALAGAR